MLHGAGVSMQSMDWVICGIAYDFCFEAPWSIRMNVPHSNADTQHAMLETTSNVYLYIIQQSVAANDIFPTTNWL